HVGDLRRAHGGGGAFDRYLPPVAGDVPEQLVMGVEPVQRAPHPVGDLVLARAGDQRALTPDPPDQEVTRALGVQVGRGVRAGADAYLVEPVPPGLAVTDRYPERDLPVDTVAGHVEILFDGLGDPQAAVGDHLDVGVERPDLPGADLCRVGGGG